MLQGTEDTATRLLQEHSGPESKGKEQEGKGGEIENAPPECESLDLDLDLDLDDAPDGLNPSQYARAFLEGFGIPTTRAWFEVVTTSIDFLAKRDRISAHAAFAVIRDRARKAVDSDVEITRFRFEDGSHLRDGERRSDAKRSRFAPESEEIARYLD